MRHVQIEPGAEARIGNITSNRSAALAPGPQIKLAGGEGFEPSYLEPESSVLPLDDPPADDDDDTKNIEMAQGPARDFRLWKPGSLPPHDGQKPPLGTKRAEQTGHVIGVFQVGLSENPGPFSGAGGGTSLSGAATRHFRAAAFRSERSGAIPGSGLRARPGRRARRLESS